MTKDTYDRLARLRPGFETTEVEYIQRAVQRLLGWLYIPVPSEISYRLDPARCACLGVDVSEPVNWGSVWCARVSDRIGETFLVTIEEAAPAACPTLCEYIHNFLTAWGWAVEVQTEW